MLLSQVLVKPKKMARWQDASDSDSEEETDSEDEEYVRKPIFFTKEVLEYYKNGSPKRVGDFARSVRPSASHLMPPPKKTEKKK